MKTRFATLPAVAVTVALLTGCAGIPGLPTSIEGIVEQATGGSAGVEIGGNGSMPDGFPSIPVPQGELIATVSTESGFVLTYRVTDEAATGALYAELIMAGFEEEEALDMGAMKTWTMTRADYRVIILYTQGDDATILYTVSPTS